MKDLLLVANWKAHKTEDEARLWLEEFNRKIFEAKLDLTNKQILICPPYTLLQLLNAYVVANALEFKIGAQDVSRFVAGAYTGEIPAEIIKKMASYTIIGHSERRQNFGDTDEVLETKVVNADASGLNIVFCVQGDSTPIPETVKIVAYEPISAIGTGNPESPENAEKVAKSIKEKNKNVEKVLYGGSVTADNIKKFTDIPDISGVLVGGASLEASNFFSLIERC
ncbi:MAG TPA: triose-phosphate isomerase family protein [Patescibacteria group bacterium]|nr:triose-phosphate isomerase family protein [Patescibacteria group bacterium]